VIARKHLWEQGLDYRHGTGHGVGSFLNVHEGPQGISMRRPANEVSMQPGMTVSNEPGYYEDGKFGIRIENVLVVKPVKTPHNFGNVEFFGFENLTVVPIQTKLINKKMLTQKQIDWVNNHNKLCLERVSPLLEKQAHDWLTKETQPF